MMSPVLLEIKGVSQDFYSGFISKPKRVLNRVSFAVKKGSVVGILGPNGAGKTTLIHLIAGIRTPSEGELKIDGLSVSEPIAREKLGYLPERPYFPEHLTGQEVLEYFGALSGMSRRELNAKVPVVLEKVKMMKAKDKELKQYSKGMLQRIGIAQALLHDPEFLLLDEPMSGLDPIGRQGMRDLLLSLHQEGKTILFSTHLIEDADSLCHEVVLIRSGELVGFGPLNSISGHEKKLYEIRLSGGESVSAVDWKSLGAEALVVPGGIRVRAPQAEKVLEAALKSGFKVLGVEEFRPTMEDFFREQGNAEKN